MVEANSLLHGAESVVFADTGYQSAGKRPDAKGKATWHVAMRPGKRKALDAGNLADQRIELAECLTASVRWRKWNIRSE